MKSLCHQSTAASAQADLKDSETLTALHKDVQVLKNNALSYADALAGKKCQPRRRQRNDHKAKKSNGMEHSPAAPKHVLKERISVIGARKIWGTLRSTTVTAVTRALETVTDLPIDQLSVKRKYKNMINSKKSVRWWFVIRGDESNLQKLEECWQLVSLQTNWKIEPLLTYKEETEEATVPQSVDVSDNNPHEESDNGGNVPTAEMPRNSEEHSDTFLSSVTSPTHQVSGSQSFLDK